MTKIDQIVAEIRRQFPDYCVEQIFGMTCSLESSVAEFAAQFPDDEPGLIAWEWITEAGEPEELKYEERARSYALWREYIDPDGHVSEEAFDAMSIEEKVNFQRDCFKWPLKLRSRKS